MMRLDDEPAPIVRRLHAILLATFLTGCFGSAAEDEPVPEPENLSYEGIYAEPVRLEAGSYQGEPYMPGGAARPRVRLAPELTARGDLTGDGAQETVVLLTESSGGSGENTFVAVVGGSDGRLRNLGTRLVGDRVQVMALAVISDTVVLDMVAAGPAEAACCPTRKVRKTYRLEGGDLAEARSEDQGPVSLSDLEGVSWELRDFDLGDPAPEEIRVSLEIAEGRVTGTAGCNRYFGAVTAGAGREVQIGSIGATRKKCENRRMEVEMRYLGALRQVRRYGFRMGRLALTWSREDGRSAVLIFEAGSRPAVPRRPDGR